MRKSVESKREREKLMVSRMIALYCKKNHRTGLCEGQEQGIERIQEVQKGNERYRVCPECAELMEYARFRSDKCPFMETKTFCSNCRVHCYKPEMREKIRQVMRFSGPRMIFYHPVAAIRHVIESRREKRRLEHSCNSEITPIE